VWTERIRLAAHPSPPLLAGIAGRCPRCGQGRLFRGLLSVRDRCEFCDLDFSAQDSGDGPVAFIVLIAGFLVVGAALIAEVRYGWPLWLHLSLWLPLAMLLSVGLLRPLKGMLIALQYRFRRDEFDG
jgi:uncharacterized protein (DUF983 family)